MGGRRRHFFVLLFVLGLVGVSLLVIVNQPTKLGLDLKGGVELIYQGTPTGESKEISGSDIDRSIEIIRERIDKLGVSEPEVSRLGETEISVSLPDVTNAQRAIDQVGTTAQLYFYDWEPSLIGREKTIGGHPGRQPPAGALKEAEKEWEDAGRKPKQPQNERLIFAGAYPSAYGAVKLASEQEPIEDCTTCSTTKKRFYLFSKDDKHELLAGPEFAEEDLYITPTGRKLAHKGEVLYDPGRHRGRLRKAAERRRRGDRGRRPGLVRAERRTGALGHRDHRPEGRTRRIRRAARSPSASPTPGARRSRT